MASRLHLPRLHLRRAWTLRGRLLAVLLGLLALVCLIIGFVSVTAVNHQVLSQVDHQLVSAGNRSIQGHGPGPGGGDRAPGGSPLDFLSQPGVAVGTLGATRTGNSISSAQILNGFSDFTAVPSTDFATLLTVPTDGKPHTIDLNGIGDYRVVATPDGDGDGTVLITGLPLKDANSTIARLTLIITVVSAIGLIGAAVAGSFIVRLTLRPLRRVSETATRVSKLRLDRGEVALRERVPDADTDTRTEVGQVGAALNSLLGHVSTALTARQASEMRVRQFVADASHELRTPLAAIRGYAELTRRTGDDLPEDITYAMDRVESEARRMTGLVEDLLLLARLDAGRPVEHAAVDLTALVIDAVSDAHAAGPHHPVRLNLPEEPVEISGDRARLHQVLTNLLTNARTHTAPGTRIEVTLRRDDEPGADGAVRLAAATATSVPSVVVEVADEGPGIPPNLLPHIFERFARADTSRSRIAGSTGLGLAIVSAVVGAHGGSVDVRTQPGHTVFSVRLPVTGRPPGDPAETEPVAAEAENPLGPSHEDSAKSDAGSLASRR